MIRCRPGALISAVQHRAKYPFHPYVSLTFLKWRDNVYKCFFNTHKCRKLSLFYNNTVTFQYRTVSNEWLTLLFVSVIFWQLDTFRHRKLNREVFYSIMPLLFYSYYNVFSTATARHFDTILWKLYITNIDTIDLHSWCNISLLNELCWYRTWLGNRF